MSVGEMVEMLEEALERHPRIQAVVSVNEEQLVVQDEHGLKHWITVEEA